MSKGTQTRQQIIQRAAVLFNQRGYTGASIQDLMQITGLQKGGIYRHFESKEQLALAAFDYAQQQTSACLVAAVQAETDPIKQLLAFVLAFQQLTLRPPIPGGCPIFNTLIESDDRDPALREQALEVVRRWEALIMSIITNGIAQGSVRPETNAQAVATVLIGVIEGAIVLRRAHADPIYIQHAVDHLTRYIERDITLMESTY